MAQISPTQQRSGLHAIRQTQSWAGDEQVIDQETNSVWNEHGVAIDGPLTGTTLTRIASGHIAFWFAWAAFYPETEVLM